MTTDPARPRASFRRRLARWTFALGFVVLPTLGILALGALWVRSCRVEETWELTYRRRTTDVVTQVDWATERSIVVVMPRGLLAATLHWEAFDMPIADAAEEQEIRAERRGVWTGNHEVFDPGGVTRPAWAWSPELPFLFDATNPADRARFVGAGPGRLLDLPRSDHALRPLTYWSYITATRLIPVTRLMVVTPFWVAMLPFLIPAFWWLWCPSGRCLPRLTLRRMWLATALVGLILALLCRSPGVDHALLTLREYDASYAYGPDPAGLGRPTLVGVLLDQSGVDHALMIDWSDAAAIRGALAKLPHLRYLALRGNPGPPSIETAMLPPSLLDLESLDLRESRADDATLTHLATFAHLQRLALTRSRGVTDAGLVHLRALPHLTHLWLGDIALTDAGLVHLRGLPALRRLSFQPVYPVHLPTRLTAAALQTLADSLPKLDELIGPDGTVYRRGQPPRPPVVAQP